MIPILFATYGAVFVAEIVGDKLLYTTGVLATRYRTVPIMIGMLVAFMAKMAVAVVIGNAISKLPPLLVAALTSISFIGVAITLWRKPVERASFEKDHRAHRAAMVSFAAIFFSEWGDVGQITAATMAARFGAPLLVWLGAVAAMATKGALAASIRCGRSPMDYVAYSSEGCPLRRCQRPAHLRHFIGCGKPSPKGTPDPSAYAEAG